MKNNPSEPAPSTLPRNLVILGLTGLVVIMTIWVLRLKNANEELATSAPKRQAPPPTNKSVAAAPREEEAPMPALPGPAPAAGEAKAPPNPMAAVASMMMNNPQMREMVIAQQKRALETRFGDIMNEMQFTPDQRARFISMMVDATSGSVDATLKMMSGTASDAERQALQQQMKEAAMAADAKTADFFAAEFPADPGKYDAFKRASEQQNDRSNANAIQTSLSQAGEAMTSEQVSALANVIGEERRAFKYTRDPNNPAVDANALFSDAGIETLLRETEQLQNRIGDRATAVLSPTQMAAYRKLMTERLQMQKMSLEAAAQMMGAAK